MFVLVPINGFTPFYLQLCHSFPTSIPQPSKKTLNSHMLTNVHQPPVLADTNMKTSSPMLSDHNHIVHASSSYGLLTMQRPLCALVVVTDLLPESTEIAGVTVVQRRLQASRWFNRGRDSQLALAQPSIHVEIGATRRSAVVFLPSALAMMSSGPQLFGVLTRPANNARSSVVVLR
ncbi:hypothetical protein BDQ12DRAFT_726285 [Crucibulum laeve]|uniref:Uncharacterized protein n=1 Tax=Crucibulum laeve TaxID=68775 RepID=A0A5C3LQL1_9AGAR|nr:hypothetical protein BDQ12DRAFT_726285 [Crucibulum laeve]